MQMWFSEYHTVNVKLDVRIEEQLFSGKSEYQKIDVFKSYEFGKMAALDGEIVFSDADEFIYDEMVTHVPMAVHPNAKKILIIGGGAPEELTEKLSRQRMVVGVRCGYNL